MNTLIMIGISELPHRMKFKSAVLPKREIYDDLKKIKKTSIMKMNNRLEITEIIIV